MQNTLAKNKLKGLPVDNHHITVGWKVSTLNPAMASLRYRALLPQIALEHRGIHGKVFSTASPACLNNIDLLVIVKSFTLEDYCLAQSAAKKDIPVILDLCDNIFVEAYKTKGKTAPADFFLLIADMASAIVVTTDPLATTVSQVIGARCPIFVVPDGLITPELLAAAQRRLLWPRLAERVRRLGSVTRVVLRKVKDKLMERVRRLGRVTRVVLSVLRKVKDKLGVLRSASQAGLLGETLRVILQNRFGALAKIGRRHYERIRALMAVSHPKLPANVRASQIPSGSVHGTHLKKPALQFSDRAEKGQIKKTILWFGNHGAAHAAFGMLDILQIREALEKLAAELPVELLVVSNSIEKFERHIRPMAISTRYSEWSENAMEGHLRNADVVVIPNSLDPFSICKSANRTVLALAHGTPVVATSTPALEPLRECMVLDDFENGLRRYLADSEYARTHTNKAQKIIDELYGQDSISRQWGEVIHYTLSHKKHHSPLTEPELIFAIHLPQDIDLASPILAAASQRGLRCAIWTSFSAMNRWTQLFEWIRRSGYEWRIFLDDLNGCDAKSFPRAVRALISVTETNLNPHRFTHQLTKLANAAGIFTVTMQHGFENVGLTYSDSVHDIGRISFASRRIYTWGNAETLHPDIPTQTKSKCYPVGCPKPQRVEQPAIQDWPLGETPVIGIFENLHWHRYSKDYRNFFVANVLAIAKAFPDINFIVKPHNAGMWLTTRYEGPPPSLDNLMIADPQSAMWAGLTAPGLLERLQAVITTPSTVALDAARQSIPIAVVAQSLELANYAPLPLIESAEDWKEYVAATLDPEARQRLIALGTRYVERVLLPGDAASHILDDSLNRDTVSRVGTNT